MELTTYPLNVLDVGPVLPSGSHFLALFASSTFKLAAGYVAEIVSRAMTTATTIFSRVDIIAPNFVSLRLSYRPSQQSIPTYKYPNFLLAKVGMFGANVLKQYSGLGFLEIPSID